MEKGDGGRNWRAHQEGAIHVPLTLLTHLLRPCSTMATLCLTLYRGEGK